MGPISAAAKSLIRLNYGSGSQSQSGNYGTYIYSPPCHSDNNYSNNTSSNNISSQNYIYSNNNFTSYTPEQYHNTFIYNGN